LKSRHPGGILDTHGIPDAHRTGILGNLWGILDTHQEPAKQILLEYWRRGILDTHFPGKILDTHFPGNNPGE
jgi:hypothetical protein